jgi:hypothetical protein
MATTDRDSTEAVRATTPQLVLVSGVPGVGKSTVAEWIADRLDAVHLRTDVVRKELFPDPSYSDAETDAVYATVVDRGREHLRAGRSAVLDATYKDREKRVGPRRAARDLDVPLRIVKVEAEPAVVRERIRQRTDDASDADVEIYERFRREFEPIERPYTTIDNSDAFEETVAQLEAAFAHERVPLSQ